jgi:hypothetical protein
MRRGVHDALADEAPAPVNWASITITQAETLNDGCALARTAAASVPPYSWSARMRYRHCGARRSRVLSRLDDPGISRQDVPTLGALPHSLEEHSAELFGPVKSRRSNRRLPPVAEPARREVAPSRADPTRLPRVPVGGKTNRELVVARGRRGCRALRHRPPYRIDPPEPPRPAWSSSAAGDQRRRTMPPATRKTVSAGRPRKNPVDVLITSQTERDSEPVRWPTSSEARRRETLLFGEHHVRIQLRS